MSASIIRADYDPLNRMATDFAHQAELTRKSLQRIRSCQDALAGGDWVGQGASAFYAEMNGQVVPALNRLARALEAASGTTRQIRAIMKAAEDEAARCLNQQGGGAVPVGATPPGTGTGSQPGRGTPGQAAIAGGQIRGTVVKDNIFVRALKPMNPMDMLGILDKGRKLLDMPDNILDVLDGVSEFQKKLGKAGRIGKFLNNPAVDKFSKGIAYYDIGRNSLKLLTDATDGNGMQLESLQTGADLFSDVMGVIPNPVTKAFNAGYTVGKFLNETFGLSSKIADALVDKSETWSSRTLVAEYVHKHGSAAEQATYKQYRADYIAQSAAAARAGQPVPTFQAPDLPVLKKLDPAVLRMAATNRDINSVAYNLALANKSKSMPPFMRQGFFK